jgi:hypothetical protein
MDIPALLTAITWPLTALIIFLAYRKHLPDLVGGLTSRITKLGIAGVEFELAVAKPYEPDSDKSNAAAEFWHKAVSSQVSDSTATTFFNQLNEGGAADYAVVNLEQGQAWLTSRLYIVSILYAQIKGVKAFVFIETEGGIRKRYIGWASTNKIRWALEARYQWLGNAYKEAYKQLLINGAQIVSENGRLGDTYNSNNVYKSIDLLREFLQQIQSPTPPPMDIKEWINLDSTPPVFEHGRWITGELLEKRLGNSLNKGYIRSSELRAKPAKEQLSLIVAIPDSFIAVITDDYRFEYMLDRTRLIEQSLSK